MRNSMRQFARFTVFLGAIALTSILGPGDWWPVGPAALLAQEGAIRRDAEEALIRSAVQDYYVEGIRTRNFDLIRAVCVPEAVLMGVRPDGGIGITTLDVWSNRFDPANPPFQSLGAEITRIDRSGEAAQVRIDFLIDHERPITDYLQMLKMAGHWRIVNIVDNG